MLADAGVGEARAMVAAARTGKAGEARTRADYMFPAR
jgi:hypothetical protein